MGERSWGGWGTLLSMSCWVTGEGLDCCSLRPEEEEAGASRCCCSMFCTFCSFFSWLASCCWRSWFT